MHIEAPGYSMPQGHEHQRNDENCQGDMRDQHGVVKIADDALTAEGCVDSSHQDFMNHISDKKDAGHYECGDHARPVGRYPPLFDEHKACRQENRGQGVEGGIDGRKIADAHPPETRRAASRSNRRQVCQM